MKTVLTFILCAVFSRLAASPSYELKSRGDLDLLSFLAGMSNHGARTGISPPRCEAFFRESGEERVAALFFEAACGLAPRDSFRRYYAPNGGRLVIECEKVHSMLQSYFHHENGIAWSDGRLMALDGKKRLSFVAGVYARHFRDGAFHDNASAPIRATILILLAEGCRVYDVSITEREVPNTIHFKVEPSPHIAQIFSMIDAWKPPALEWIE